MLLFVCAMDVCWWVGQNIIFVSYDLHLICALVHYAKSVIFLSTVFFLLSGCPFRCFDRMPALSVCCGYHIPSERDAKNSVKVSVSSGTRHIFASMLKMCLAGTSLCQRCLLPDEIPSAPSKHHKVSAFRRTIQCFLSNIGKTVLIVKRKTCVLELRHFKVNQILFLFQ